MFSCYDLTFILDGKEYKINDLLEVNLSNNNNLDEEARKRRTSNVYSNTYDNGGWSVHDAIPTGDPIGDVPETYKKEDEEFMKMIKSAGKHLHPEDKPCCSKSENHKKVPLVYSVYRMCKVCGADLGDW
jgi:hypothetical protein